MKKVLLVTGGSRGIGAAIVRASVKEGYAVAINYRSRSEEALALEAEVVRAGGEAVSIAADVAREDDVARLFERVDATLGTVTALVNNAGILEKQGRVVDMDPARWQRVYATNVVGSFLCAREAIRRMSRSRGGIGGAIVNISSLAARTGSPGEYVDYAASKAALDAFTVGLAKEVAEEGVRVNAVRPGAIYTEIHASGGEPGRVERVRSKVPMGRGGQPEEIASAVMWLLSDGASYTTGAIVDVAGGA